MEEQRTQKKTIVHVDGRHRWKDSRYFFIGSLYSSIYPRYCECGAFMKANGEIIEPIQPGH